MAVPSGRQQGRLIGGPADGQEFDMAGFWYSFSDRQEEELAKAVIASRWDGKWSVMPLFRRSAFVVTPTSSPSPVYVRDPDAAGYVYRFVDVISPLDMTPWMRKHLDAV